VTFGGLEISALALEFGGGELSALPPFPVDLAGDRGAFEGEFDRARKIALSVGRARTLRGGDEAGDKNWRSDRRTSSRQGREPVVDALLALSARLEPQDARLAERSRSWSSGRSATRGTET
jgi:hypothetical protein